jgi:hypothetical protein
LDAEYAAPAFWIDKKRKGDKRLCLDYRDLNNRTKKDAYNTKGSYLGVTAHWIEVVGKKWELRTNVIGFRAISGEHSGWNLGRYLIGACDRMGICSKNGSKVSPIMGILLISIIDNG